LAWPQQIERVKNWVAIVNIELLEQKKKSSPSSKGCTESFIGVKIQYVASTLLQRI